MIDGVLEPIRFVVTLDDIRDARRLRQRRLVGWIGTLLVLTGLLLWLVVGTAGGVLVIALGIFEFIDWRYSIVNGWFDRRGMVVGSECEVLLDESAIHVRQGRGGAFDLTLQFDWSRVTGLLEDDRAILVMGGRAPLVGIPRSAFGSATALAAFRDEIRKHTSEQRQERAAT